MSRKPRPITDATPEEVVRALMKPDYPKRREVESDCKEKDEYLDDEDSNLEDKE